MWRGHQQPVWRGPGAQTQGHAQCIPVPVTELAETPSSGNSAWLSAAKLTSPSNSTPATRRTILPALGAASARAFSSAVLPTPGSPDSSSAPPLTAACRKNSCR